MPPLIDPRKGDFECDASSSKNRSMLSIAGSLLAEIGIPKLIVAWIALIGLPSLMLGAMPIVASIWVSTTAVKLDSATYGLLPLLFLALLAIVGHTRRAQAVPDRRAELSVAPCDCRSARLCGLP